MTIYIVTKDGSGTHSTIQAAANVAVAGDTIQVKNGIYNEKVILQNSGSLNNYITFSAYPGHFPIINGNGVSIHCDGNGVGDGLFTIYGKNYINIKDFRLINSSCTGISVLNSCSNININNNYIENTYSSGVLVKGGNNIILDNNEINLANNAPSTVTVQEIISIQAVDNFEIKNNYIHDGGNPQYGGEGIDAKWSVSNGKIHHNELHDVVSVGIYVDAWDSYAKYIDIYNNIVHHINRRSGIGIAVGAENGGTTDNIRVYNNISHSNNSSGFLSPTTSYAGTIKNVSIVNNTLYNNSIGTSTMGGINIQVWTSGANVSNYTISNNIVQDNQGFEIAVGISGVSNININNNLIYPFRNFDKETKGINYVESDALFMSTDFANSKFLHLQSISPAINKGSSTQFYPLTDFDGNLRTENPDIGAYEYICLSPGCGFDLKQS